MIHRLFYLDNLKAILIILVVLGHAIQFAVPEYLHNFAFRFIYSFHMPLFLAISGFLTYKKQPDRNLIKKRAVQLLIPFVVWAFIRPLVDNGCFDLQHTLTALLYPDNGLWFLYNLFVYSACFNISEFIEANYNVRQEYVLSVLFGLMIVSMVAFKTMMNCTQLVWYIPFFAIGYYIRKYHDLIKQKEFQIMILGGAIFLLGMPFWMMREDPLFYKWINLGSIFSYLYRWLIMMAGAIFFLLAGKKYLNQTSLFLGNIGKHTLGIYAMQFTILHYLGKLLVIESVPLRIVVSTILCVAICFMLTVCIGKVKYLRTLLIGVK